jgi:hypothetical protein
MITCICRCSNHWSALHRSELIGDSIALRWNKLLTCPPQQRNIWRFNARPGHRTRVAVQFIGYSNTMRPGSTLQIPIGM